MNKNTYSLLGGPWLLSDAATNALMPALITLVKGKTLPEAKPDTIAVYAEYDEDQEVQEYDTVEELQSDAKYIPVLSIKNTIFKYDQFCGPRGTQSMIRLMKSWEGNDNIMGVVLDIDSGGGQASGTSEFAEFIANYSKPVVAYTNGMICSAAYWIASAAKGGIIVNKGADFIGSIGTMIRYVNLDGVLISEGAVIEDIYATLSTRKNEESREKDNNKSNVLIVNNILDPYNKRFHTAVATARPELTEEVYSGAIYLPEAALSLKLIDSIGTLNDAFDKIIAMSKANKPSKLQNSNTMSKPRANVQAVLGLAAPLASTDNGSYLNDEQLDTLENSLTAAEADKAKLANERDTATAAQQKAETDLANAQKAHNDATTALDTKVDSLVAAAGITAEGTTTEKLNALEAHYAAINKADGAKHTNPKTDGKQADPSASYVDANASHNQLAKELLS